VALGVAVDAEALWALTEAHLTLHGSAGSRVSLHTLAAYRCGLNDLLKAWQGENLLRPRRNAGVLYVRELEGRLKPASVGVKLAAAKAFYAALRWLGATDTAPFADVRAAVDKTPAWEKRDAYTRTEVAWLERTSEHYTLYIVLLGAHAGLRVSEMTALKWEDIDLGSGTLKVVAGKGGKTARVNLSSTLIEVLEHVPLEKRTGYLLPARLLGRGLRRISGSKRRAGRLKSSSRVFMRYDMRPEHGLEMKLETSPWLPITFITRAWIPPAVTLKPAIND